MLEIRHPYPLRSNYEAYVVTRGLLPGVYTDWYVVYNLIHTHFPYQLIRNVAKALTDGISRQVVVGYSSLAEAQAAYDCAMSIGAVETISRQSKKSEQKRRRHHIQLTRAFNASSSSSPNLPSLNPSPGRFLSSYHLAPFRGPIVSWQ
jgi:hypothetical protein